MTESCSQRMAECQNRLDHLLTIHVRHRMHRQQPPSCVWCAETLQGGLYVEQIHRNSLVLPYAVLTLFSQKLTKPKTLLQWQRVATFAIGTSILWLNDSRPAETQLSTVSANLIPLALLISVSGMTGSEMIQLELRYITSCPTPSISGQDGCRGLHAGPGRRGPAAVGTLAGCFNYERQVPVDYCR